jgi:hypothetical protein
VPSYPAGMTVSNRALNMLADALRHRRRTIGTRWRRLEAGQQALLVVAHLRKGETLWVPRTAPPPLISAFRGPTSTSPSLANPAG